MRPASIQNKEKDSNPDFYKNLIKKMLKKWYVFAICSFFAGALGVFLLLSSSRKYENTLTFLIQEKNDRKYKRSELDQFQMFSQPSTVEDELGILGSYPLVFETVKQLDLEVSYFKTKKLITPEIYKDSPIEVIFDPEVPQPIGIKFELANLTKDIYTLTVENVEEAGLYDFSTDKLVGEIENINFSERYNFGDEVSIGKSKFKIILNSNFNEKKLKDSKLYFRFNDLNRLAYFFQQNLEIERTSKEASLVDVAFAGSNPVIVTDFLNTLAETYLRKNLEKKNKIADKTISFIDKQISGIADSLGLTANTLKNFRVRNNVMDIDFLSKNVYEQMRELEEERASLVVASKYYNYIERYFKEDKDLNKLLAPSAMGVDDSQLKKLIQQLTEKNAQRALQLDGNSVNNPMLPILNAEINNLQKTILENIAYIVETSNITIRDIDERIAILKKQVRKLPTIEKELKNIEREFIVNDNIYTYLLETRAEAEIARASNSPDYEVISPAFYHNISTTGSKKKIIYFVVFLIGVIIPVGYILLKSNINNFVENKVEVERISSFPVIGSVAVNDKKSLLPLYDFRKSLISESFRSVRTSMMFFRKGEKKKKILITSSMQGDGKSFIACNLAAAYASAGKKTILVEFELRNPKLEEFFEQESLEGLSAFLNNSADIETITHETKIKNLDVIYAGEIPQNPVELIASTYTNKLFEILEEKYDYIIMDAPPIGIVTDSYLLMEHSDVNLFVVRLNHTNKSFFSSLIKDLEQKEIQNVGMVINQDEEKANSNYYSGSMNKSYFSRKFDTFKSLIGLKKKKIA